MKIIRTINVEGEVWVEAQRLYPGALSSQIEDYLRSLVAVSNADIDGIDIQLLEKKRVENEQKLAEYQANQSQIMQKLEILHQKQAEKEEMELIKMKEEMKKTVSCLLCGNNFTGVELVKLGNSKICKGCFATNDPKKLLELMKK